MQFKEFSLTISSLFDEMGYDYLSLKENEPIDVSTLGYEIQTFENGNLSWARINKLVRKSVSDSYVIEDLDLRVSGDHLFWVCADRSDRLNKPQWLKAEYIAANFAEIAFLTDDESWQYFSIKKENKKTDILDIEVEGTHSYFSNGVLSHNTMYGDPMISPGGNGLPFHSSVRIRLGSGNPIKDKAGNVVGIHTTVTIKKNKVGYPYRKCDFDILFGQGIAEAESLFDVLRKKCKDEGAVERGSVKLMLDGDGAWKEFTVSDKGTGEVLYTKKFYKSEFKDLLNDQTASPFLNELIDDVLTIKNRGALNSDDLVVDSDDVLEDS